MFFGCSSDENPKTPIPKSKKIVSNIEFKGTTADEFTNELISYINDTKGLGYTCVNVENLVSTMLSPIRIV